MGALNVALWVGGVGLVAIGFLRARGPWNRYRALQEQDANVARYGAWRGGRRDDGQPGASVAMAVLRQQVRNGALIAVAGVVLIGAGFALPS